jgi:trans-aconitate 2-methyltransferase
MGDWDARTYEEMSAPQVRWGASVLRQISLDGDESALDAGCGTGRVTRLLAGRLPRGRVLAVDVSPAMVAEARTRLADLAPRVRVRRADLLEFATPEPVDLVFSTATFHWIADHPRLFARLFDALAPGGLLVAQCGGEGNIARALAAAATEAARRPFAAHLRAPLPEVHFAGPDTTARRLRDAGFTAVDVWLHAAPADVGDAAEGARYLRAIVLRPHLALLPADLHERFAGAVAARMAAGDPGGRVVIDYVRLEMRGRRRIVGAMP